MKALAQPEMPTFKHDRIAEVQAALGHARRKRALSREGRCAAMNDDVASEVKAEGLRRGDVGFDCETWHGSVGSSLTNEVQRRAKRIYERGLSSACRRSKMGAGLRGQPRRAPQVWKGGQPRESLRWVGRPQQE